MNLNEEMTIAILALQLVLLAFQLWLIYRQLILSDRAEHRAQTHSKLSVTPALDFEIDCHNDRLSIVLKNYGIGPGRITNLDFFVDGQPFSTRIPSQPTISLLCAALSVTWGSECFMREIRRETWLAVNGSLNLLLLIAFPTTAAAVKCRDRIIVRVKYESMYGEKFVASTEDFCSLSHG
jgi:hypothetical protein